MKPLTWNRRRGRGSWRFGRPCPGKNDAIWQSAAFRPSVSFRPYPLDLLYPSVSLDLLYPSVSGASVSFYFRPCFCTLTRHTRCGAHLNPKRHPEEPERHPKIQPKRQPNRHPKRHPNLDGIQKDIQKYIQKDIQNGIQNVFRRHVSHPGLPGR